MTGLRRIVLGSIATKLVENPLYLATVMIKNGDADGEVAGAPAGQAGQPGAGRRDLAQHPAPGMERCQ